MSIWVSSAVPVPAVDEAIAVPPLVAARKNVDPAPPVTQYVDVDPNPPGMPAPAKVTAIPFDHGCPDAGAAVNTAGAAWVAVNANGPADSTNENDSAAAKPGVSTADHDPDDGDSAALSFASSDTLNVPAAPATGAVTAAGGISSSSAVSVNHPDGVNTAVPPCPAPPRVPVMVTK